MEQHHQNQSHGNGQQLQPQQHQQRVVHPPAQLANIYQQFEQQQQQQQQRNIGGMGPDVLGTGLLFSSTALLAEPAQQTQQIQGGMSMDEQQFQQQMNHLLQRPMSLPNYGGGLEIY